MVHEGEATDVMPTFAGPYDLGFLDGNLTVYRTSLDQFLRLLRPGGLLITSNLFLGQHTEDVPDIDEAVAYRERLLDDRKLRTVFLPGGLALSLRV